MDGSILKAGNLFQLESLSQTKTGGDNRGPYLLVFFILAMFLLSARAYGVSLDGGEDMSGEFTTAASLLKTFDRIIFGWGSPLVGAIFLFWSTWALIQQKVVMFFIALVAAIFILIVPKFIKDLNSLNDGTIFSKASHKVERSNV